MIIKVVDRSSNILLENVRVCFYAKEEMLGCTMTDSNGVGSLDVPARKGYLECKMIGYEKLIIANVELQPHKRHHYNFKLSLLTYN